MILPIVAFGHPALRAETEEITAEYPNLKELLSNMWDTMYMAHGVGLAAPQVGLSIRLFLVDSAQLDEEGEEPTGIKQAFINAEILEEEGESWAYEEGCLSIPDIREKVIRQPKIRIRYQDENFEVHEKEFDGMNARIIQHEYDHIEGVLFTDYLGPLKKRLIKRKLSNIQSGKIDVKYKMKFPK
jgi:peptide deformylase